MKFCKKLNLSLCDACIYFETLDGDEDHINGPRCWVFFYKNLVQEFGLKQILKSVDVLSPNPKYFLAAIKLLDLEAAYEKLSILI